MAFAGFLTFKCLYPISAEELSGIFVKSINPGSVADLSGRIQINDQIVEVDGQSLRGFNNHQAVEVLRSTGQVVRLTLARYLRGPKYDQLQQAMAESTVATGSVAEATAVPSYRPPSPPLPSPPTIPRSPPPALPIVFQESASPPKQSDAVLQPVPPPVFLAGQQQQQQQQLADSIDASPRLPQVPVRVDANKTFPICCHPARSPLHQMTISSSSSSFSMNILTVGTRV